MVCLFRALFAHNTFYSAQQLHFHRDLVNGSATHERIEAKVGL